MRIKRYACEQYAGTTNRDITFGDGINVVLGKNESGKSTLALGIHDVLVKSTKLDARKDKDFLSSRFPANGANIIDGTVELETDAGIVTIKKEWDKKNAGRRVSLTFPFGMKLSGEDAEKKLSKILKFGPSVFGNVLFGRQNNEQEIMDWFYSFLDATDESNGMDEVRKKVSGAVSAAGGISEERFRNLLEEKISALLSHWDMEASLPEGRRGINRPWKVNVGKILEAYYEKERKLEELNNAKELVSIQREVEEDLAEYRQKKEELEKRLSSLQEQKASIETAAFLMEKEASLKESLEEQKDIFDKWPKKQTQMNELSCLMDEQVSSENQEKKKKLLLELEKLEAVEKEISRLEAEIKETSDLEEDFRLYRDLNSQLPGKAALLSARFTVKYQVGGKIRYDTLGKRACMAGSGETHGEGFVKFTFGDGSFLLVEPEGTDTRALEDEIGKMKSDMHGICEKYSIDEENALELLENRYKKYLENKSLLAGKKAVLDAAGKTPEEIREELGEIPEALCIPREGLDDVISSVLKEYGVKTMEAAQAVVSAQIDAYQRVYGSREYLEKQILATEAELKDIAGKKEQMDIRMTKDEFDWEVKRTVMQLDETREKLEKLVSSAGAMDAKCADLDIGQLEAEEAGLEEKLDGLVALCKNYQRILSDYDKMKEGADAEYDLFFSVFNRYLLEITGGSISVDYEGIIGKNGRIGGELLSRGTKQSVLLAFRLAMLTFYYQDESGVVVLDDTLLDMDDTRRAGAVKLIREFARENQVICLTCDPAVAEMLGGNLITV